MTVVKEVGSREARRNFREMLDTVMSGRSDVAIHRHGQEVAYLISAADYHAVADELEEVRVARLAESIYEEYRAKPHSAKPYDEVKAEILGEG